MNDLRHYFENNDGPLINKFLHYFDVYERHFAPFRNTPVNVLEVGIYQGGSLRMWKDYFGPQASIFGFDINPHCKSLEEEGVSISIGNQEDKTDLRQLADRLPAIDILIDDGGHLPRQQINTFEVFYPRLSENGIYLCEDLHSSYLKDHKGGYKKATFIEYAKDLIDQLNAWHSETDRLVVNDFTRSTYGLHFYESMLVIEKKPITEPTSKRTGRMTVPDMEPLSLLGRVRRKWNVTRHNMSYRD
jgi:hypothetical protein